MRTTLNIEEEALAYAKERARATGKPLGAIVSEALKEAAKPRSTAIKTSPAGHPYIAAAPGGNKVTSRQIEEALDEEDNDRHAFTRR